MTTVRDLRRVTAARAAVRPQRVPELCDLCGGEVAEEHRHLLHLDERRIMCACESCFALRSGDPELRPTGTRIEWLDGFRLDEDVWARLRIPIGLAFLFRSSASGGMAAFYPSPAGATESELHLSAWEELATVNPALATLEADTEALIVNRLAEPPQFAIAPIDRCYGLVGLVKLRWEGINGGANLKDSIAGYLEGLRREAVA
jgi:hypothetical protein